jgi:hypothetical protein
VRHHVHQPQRHDDEGWERRRSLSPTGYGGAHRRSVLSVGHDGGHSSVKPSLTGVEHAPSAVELLQQQEVTGQGDDLSRKDKGEIFLPDMVLTSFPHLCSLDSQGDNFLSWRRMDPMLLESTSRSLLGEAPGPQEIVNSPVYVPVSHEWQPPAAAEAEEVRKDQMSATKAGKEQSVICFGGAGLDGLGGPVQPNAEGGPIPGGQPNMFQTQEEDSAFLDIVRIDGPRGEG